jgi:plasmid stability protein
MGSVASIAINVVVTMASVSIRDLDDEVRERLRVQAARNGRSMEAEIRSILTEAVGASGNGTGLLGAVLERFGAVGGVELDVQARRERPRAADLAE